jgi:glycosyltransferase involved in cell wall biosynthesis
VNIVLYTPDFLPSIGGREVVVHHLASCFQKLGHNVRVLGPRGWRERHCLRFPYPVHVWPGLQGLFPEQTALAHLWFDTRVYGCDIVHAHSTYPNGYAAARLKALSKSFRKVPLVVTPHGEDIHVVPEIGFGQRLDPIQRPKIEYALDNADLITAISKGVEESLLDADVDPARIRRIPNGVDVDRFEKRQSVDVRGWLKFAADARIVVTIGNYHPRKGQDVLIRAMAEVVKTEPRTRLVIIGTKTDALSPLIKELNLEGYVALTGRLDVPVPRTMTEIVDDRSTQPDLVAAILKASEMYVSAGTYEGAEGLSLAVLEALACGLPIVATRISGNVDIIKDGENGMLVPPSQPAPLAEGILHLLRDREMHGRLAENARATGLRYRWGEIASQYLDAYQEALTKGKLPDDTL